MILIGNSSFLPSGNVLYYMNTMFPNSSPLTKYSTEGPRLPPPAQTSSIKVISSGSISNSSVNHLKILLHYLKFFSTHSSFQNVLLLL